MSSCIICHGPQGFVVSTDRIVSKNFLDHEGNKLGSVKGSTRKLFQLHEDVVVACVGTWETYFPIVNAVARLELSAERCVKELHQRFQEAEDSRVYIVYREKGEEGPQVSLDVIDLGHVREKQSGAIIYPVEHVANLFVTMYEAEAAAPIRQSGMMGIAALINAYNAFALSLCEEIEGPFDTICFLKDGIFEFSGGVVRLPVGNFR